MSGVVGICPRDNGAVRYEVITVSVVFISVSVIIFIAIQIFLFVHPDVVFQVGVGVHYAFIQYGNDDRGVSFALCPCLYTAYVASGY